MSGGGGGRAVGGRARLPCLPSHRLENSHAPQGFAPTRLPHTRVHLTPSPPSPPPPLCRSSTMVTDTPQQARELAFGGPERHKVCLCASVCCAVARVCVSPAPLLLRPPSSRTHPTAPPHLRRWCLWTAPFSPRQASSPAACTGGACSRAVPGHPPTHAPTHPPTHAPPPPPPPPGACAATWRRGRAPGMPWSWTSSSRRGPLSFLPSILPCVPHASRVAGCPLTRSLVRLLSASLPSRALAHPPARSPACAGEGRGGAAPGRAALCARAHHRGAGRAAAAGRG